MGGAPHAPCQVALDMLIFCIQAKTLRRRKAVKLFFVISKRFRVQRRAAQVPLDMPIYLSTRKDFAKNEGYKTTFVTSRRLMGGAPRAPCEEEKQ